MPAPPSTRPSDASPTDRVRVLLVGYGYAGKTFHAPLITATPGLALTAVVSRDASKVHADLPDVAVHADPLRAIVEDAVDLVVIATPNETHAPLARAALESAKHVVVDKPFTLDVEDARALAELAHERHRVLSVFQNRRWDSDFLTVARAIETGAIGDVVHFESHFDRYRPTVRARWREQAVPGAGLWFDLGPHLIDQTLALFGLPDRIAAHLTIQRDGSETVDWAHAVLDYGAPRAVLHASMLTAGGTSRFTVHGTTGSLQKRLPDPQEAQLLRGLRPGEAGWGEDPDPLLRFDPGSIEPVPEPALPGDQRAYYAGLCDAIRNDGRNPVTAEQAVTVMVVLEAALRSSATGQTLPFAWTDADRRAWPAR
jgi:predicted dehydrogenase